MENLIPVIKPGETENEKNDAAAIMAETDPWKTLGISFDQVLNMLNDPLNTTWVAYSGDTVIGVAVIQMEGAFAGYLKSLAVKPGWRGKHIGEHLMKFIEEKIFSGNQNVFLCVSSFNLSAQKFYLNQGYTRVGKLTDYLVEGYDELLFRKTKGPILQVFEP